MDFTYMKSFMDRLTGWRIPGNTIRIYLGGKEVFRYQSGYSDMENKIKMNGDELFNIYSCSKVATVTAALQLYEQGYFLLSDPLYDFIPEFKEMFVKTKSGELEKAERPITLRHLFTMTAGLTYSTDTPAFQKASALTEGKMDTLTVIRSLADDPLAFQPGERWGYSLCHDVLAAVVEVVSGKRFRDYVRENIFDPLDMNQSYYQATPQVEAGMAQQYIFVNAQDTDDIVKLQSARQESGGTAKNAGKAASLRFGENYDSGGAGIISTADDYVKLAAALANCGMGINGERILSPGTVELLKTNQLNDAQLDSLSWSQLKGYGYGLGVRTMLSRAESGSPGSTGEFGWGGAAGATLLADTSCNLAMFYAHHMLNPHEEYYQPRLRNVLYTCLGR